MKPFPLTPFAALRLCALALKVPRPAEWLRPGLLVLALLLTAWPGPASAATDTNLAAKLVAPGPLTVETLRLDWTDAVRQRGVPVKVYFPERGAGPFPVIVFSHGLGGSREGYAYLGQHWASHGYVCVHLQHAGSDTAVLRGTAEPMSAMRAAASATNTWQRGLDVRFALDQLQTLNTAAGPLQHRLDLQHIGMAGHSFGAQTTLLMAGQGADLTGGRFADARLSAAIAMSPAPAARRGSAPYAAIHIPVFHLTGTLDDSPVNDTKAAQRRIPFDSSDASEQYLVTFTGSDHMVFSGRLTGTAARQTDEEFQRLIRQSTLAFWNAHLKNDAEAHRWLAAGGFAEALGDKGVFEHKSGPRGAPASGPAGVGR